MALEGLATRLREADPELAPGLRYLIKLRQAERASARRTLRRALRSERIDQFHALVALLRLADDQRVHLDAARLSRPTEAPPTAEEAQHA